MTPRPRSSLPAHQQAQVLGQIHIPKGFTVIHDKGAAASAIASLAVPVPVERPKAKGGPKYAIRTKALFKWQEIPEAVTEHRFAPPRRWRFDYAWPEQKIALEVEGGVWTGGRHTRGSGFVKDMEKYNRAAVLGWRVVRCTPSTLNAPETQEMLAQLLSRTPQPKSATNGPRLGEP